MRRKKKNNYMSLKCFILQILNILTFEWLLSFIILYCFSTFQVSIKIFQRRLQNNLRLLNEQASNNECINIFKHNFHHFELSKFWSSQQFILCYAYLIILNYFFFLQNYLQIQISKEKKSFLILNFICFINRALFFIIVGTIVKSLKFNSSYRN